MDAKCTVHVTNSNARVAVCSCGWVGLLHPLRKYMDHKAEKWRSDVAAADDAAMEDWSVHNKVRHLRLAPPDPERTREIVTHRGR